MQRSPAALCEILDIDRPVLLAPMARVAGGALASAVDHAGGFGVIGGGYGDLAWIAEQRIFAGSAAIGIGLITWTLSDATLAGVLALGPVAVWFSFGDPSPYIGRVHAAGSLVICQVGTVAEAVQAIDAGADIVVAQGSEAGGHARASHPLTDLLTAIRAVRPQALLVAAGGINDRTDYDAAVSRGADGVAIGTRLYATHESIDTQEAKARLVSARGADTVLSRVYDHVRGPVWPVGYVARTVRTTLTDEWAGREDELAACAVSIRPGYEVAVAASDMTTRALFAGQGLDAITSILPASDVVERFPRIRTIDHNTRQAPHA